MNSRILLFLMTLLLVPVLTYFVILFARGYRPGINRAGNAVLQPTGILAANSLPEGAQLYINGLFKSATNTNLNLTPGAYEIEIKKESYYPWKKTLQIKPEEVTRAAAVLFPTIPALKAITTTGASLPTLSPDGTKIVYVQSLNKLSNVYIYDLNDSPIGILNRDPRLAFTLNTKIKGLGWSPDSKQVMAQASTSAYLGDANQAVAPILVASPSSQLATWARVVKTREDLKLAALPLPLRETLASSAANLVWSPKENKVMYTATASGMLAPNLVRPLPGSSTQPQERTLVPGSIYVYDLEEDRNFKVGQVDSKVKLSWFPTSWHLVRLEKNTVTIFEYDGGNPTVVYAGPMDYSYAFPYPTSRQLLILTNLDPTVSADLNLYAVSLR